MQPSHPDYPKPTSTATVSVMKANKRANTQPEVLIRKYLHGAGFRFRKDYNIKVGKKNLRPDIVFTKLKIAVFIDGCFWHSCPSHGHIPKSNIHYWEPKLKKNIQRDKDTDKALKDAGWKIVRIWEHVPVREASKQIIMTINHEQQCLKNGCK